MRGLSLYKNWFDEVKGQGSWTDNQLSSFYYLFKVSQDTLKNQQTIGGKINAE